MANPLTVDRLRELLAHDPVTGVFTWRVQRSNRAAGSRAGTLRPDGYRQICIGRVFYLEHRLARFYPTGEWPADEVDHEQGAKADNRAAELRDATRSQNMQNRRRAQVNSHSGVLGVSWDKRKSKWRAVIDKKHLGYFDDCGDAKEFRDLAAAMLHPFSPEARV